MKWKLALALVLCGMFASVAHLRAELIYAVTTANVLLSFDSATPGTVTTIGPITGLQIGENVLAIDLRPATGQLYALGSTSRLYTINTTTAVATQVGSAGAFTLSGTFFGFDFNPVVDRIRVVSDSDQNIRLNPNDGTLTATDVSLAYAAGDPNAGANPSVVAAAYDNNVVGAASTTLFEIDDAIDILVRQGSPTGTPISPNSGQLFTIGALTFPISALGVGLDISGVTGLAYGCAGSPGANVLFTINLATGAMTIIGSIAGLVVVRDVTVGVQGAPITPTPTQTSTATPTQTSTATATQTATATPTSTAAVATPSATATPTATATATLTPTTTTTPTASATATVTPTATTTATAMSTVTPTSTVTVPASPSPTTTLAPGNPAAGIPTLSGWFLAVLALAIGTTGWFVLRGISATG